MTNFISGNGHLITLSAANRGDLYLVDLQNSQNNKREEKIWYRNIPKLKARWRYPLVSEINAKSLIKLEPTTMVAIGRKYKSRFNKFGVIDSPKSELSENNIFNAIRLLSGILSIYFASTSLDQGH